MTFGKNLSLALVAVCLLIGTAEAGDKEMLVKFRKAPGPAEEAAIKEVGGRIKRRLGFINTIAVSLPEGASDSLLRNPAVASVQENRPVGLPSPEISPEIRALSATVSGIEMPADEYEASWGVRRIGAKILHDKAVTGRGVKVAVLDTGINYNNPELKAVYKMGSNFIYPGTTDPMDDTTSGHGTHVAGIIAAARNGTGVVGVAPEVELYVAKVLGGDTFGSEDSILAGFQWAIDQQVNIINASLQLPNTTTMADALRKAEEAGILVVVAAGNFKKEIPYLEETFGSAIFVTATDQADAFASAFSNFGPQADFAAPGAGIVSTVGASGYEYMAGTSQATPHVAGAAALLLSAGPPDLDGNGTPDARDVRLQLEQLALDLGASGRDPQFGHGLLQVAENTPAENTTTTLTLLRSTSYPGKDAKTVTVANGRFHIVIKNTNLSAVIVRVLDDGFPVRHLSRLIRFKRRGTTEEFTIDASNRTLEVDFTPMGQAGATAQVVLEKQ